MARPTEITQKHIDFIKVATEANMTVREIAEQIGFSRSTVNNIQKHYGFERPKTLLTFN
ncbi:helix-turn-helix domain-containing protein [Vibrio vulnificus]|nr:helix-turn-helix domain-containing protein [Vibrio vulnificus]